MHIDLSIFSWTSRIWHLICCRSFRSVACQYWDWVNLLNKLTKIAPPVLRHWTNLTIIGTSNSTNHQHIMIIVRIMNRGGCSRTCQLAILVIMTKTTHNHADNMEMIGTVKWSMHFKMSLISALHISRCKNMIILFIYLWFFKWNTY